MRLAILGLLALAFAVPSQAQEAVQPGPRSTYVAPSHNGEAIRVMTYAQRPTERGRLARRYRGLRANRSPRTEYRVVTARPVAPVISSPRHRFVRIGGSFYQVVPNR